MRRVERAGDGREPALRRSQLDAGVVCWGAKNTSTQLWARLGVLCGGTSTCWCLACVSTHVQAQQQPGVVALVACTTGGLDCSYRFGTKLLRGCACKVCARYPPPHSARGTPPSRAALAELGPHLTSGLADFQRVWNLHVEQGQQLLLKEGARSTFRRARQPWQRRCRRT